MLPVIVLPLALAESAFVRRAGLWAVPVGTAALIAAIVVFKGVSWPRQWPTSWRPPNLACVESVLDERHRFGLADYWNAKPLTLFTRGRRFVVHVAQGGEPEHWINSIDWYRDSRHGPWSFILTERLDPSALRRHYREPSRTAPCGDGEIWIYDDPSFDPLVRERFAHPPLQP
jgi:hypothetical protein